MDEKIPESFPPKDEDGYTDLMKEFEALKYPAVLTVPEKVR